MKFNATFGPALLFLCVYLNGCLAHNIYLTYYHFKKSYIKRIKTYRISALIIAALIYFITLINLDFINFHLFYKPDNDSIESNKPIKIYIFKGSNNTKFNSSEENLTENFVCFNSKFIFSFYAIIFCVLCYILHHLYYIINRGDLDFIGFNGK